MLEELARIPTSGARAVEPFEIDGQQYLAIPQLAFDIPGAPADMNGGDSMVTCVLVLHRRPGTVLFEECQRLPAPGGEDAEFFQIGNRAFLAVACIRDGAGPYNYAQSQHIYEWRHGRFELFQQVEGYAAKQWKHFQIDTRHFLGLAQGVSLPGHELSNLPSRLYEWDGRQFVLFQDVPSAWGYNWHAFDIGAEHFLAYADHFVPSLLLRWNGTEFVHYQDLADVHGRAFAHFTREGTDYLAVARLSSESVVLRWDGTRFVPHQVLEKLGARELKLVARGDALYLVRVNFIEGTPREPIAALDSQVYRWQNERFEVVQTFATTGGTDVAIWDDAALGTLAAVSNSLTADLRFACSTNIYRCVF